MNNIAIVIPTLGRESLLDAIDSIKKQTNNSWIIYIGFDGVDPNIKSEEKIKIFKIEKNNDAGMTRNKILDHVEEDFVLFLDDDDTLANTAIEIHRKYLIEQNYDIVIPKSESAYRVLPKYNVIAQGNVGIWFSYNFKKYKNTRFDFGLLEDYKFLIKLYQKTKNIKWVDEILYNVGRKDRGQLDYQIKL